MAKVNEELHDHLMKTIQDWMCAQPDPYVTAPEVVETLLAVVSRWFEARNQRAEDLAKRLGVDS
jgi:hypothetical protein